MAKKFSNVGEVPLALGVFLASDDYDYNSDPLTISATTLIKPLRQTILSARLAPSDGIVPLADMMANRIGAAIHGGIEQAWFDDAKRTKALQAMNYPNSVISRIRVNPTDDDLKADSQIIPVYLEQRLSQKLGKWTITGKFDFIGEGTVQDFKSTTVFTYVNQVNNDKYVLQGSIYRWLDPNKITEGVMKIHYIFKDWSRAKAAADSNYPPKNFHTQTYSLMSEAETKMFIKNKLALLEKYWDEPEENIPECSDEDLWRSETVWKYYKNPTKTNRSTKNFESAPEAYQRAADDGNVGIVKEVPGSVMACKYCPAFAVCTQKDRLVAAGQLIL